nr:PREDICTED: probable E3 ubiquitin-protein ligase RNF217 [Latimeria chalumnae]|eukprot:XP_005990532.1 PREDICTED: probable E3 ubiquitin-protein ligase RNF217 [Latimeria chalumnae]
MEEDEKSEVNGAGREMLTFTSGGGDEPERRGAGAPGPEDGPADDPLAGGEDGDGEGRVASPDLACEARMQGVRLEAVGTEDRDPQARRAASDLIPKNRTAAADPGSGSESGAAEPAGVVLEAQGRGVPAPVPLALDREPKAGEPGSEEDWSPPGSRGGSPTPAKDPGEGNREPGRTPSEGADRSKKHVYCTVYRAENDNYKGSVSGSLEDKMRFSDLGQVVPAGDGSLSRQVPPDLDRYSNQEQLFSISSLIDSNLVANPYSVDYSPFIVLTCRVCLEDKQIKPLLCCKKAVCEECLKRYLSSQIQCPMCQFVWCFRCHAPWHEGLNCKEYKKGDKLLRHWASEIEHGQRNAQKCPKCKIHIQRTEGCDHMTCSQCNTNFCYRCGERYRQLRFFGDHTSNLSIFGCKYRYLPERPHLRRLVRGSVCAGKLLIAPLILVLVLALGAVAFVIGLFVFPVYYLCKKQRKRSRTGMPM